MSEPARYRIRLLQDFAGVPDDRLDACLAEFAMAVRSYRELRSALVATAGQDGRAAAELRQVTSLAEFAWTDDGKAVTRVLFADADAAKGGEG